MKSRFFLVLSALLFVSWLGWLGFLAVRTAARPAVLSRPQFLAAQIDVIAAVKEANGRPDPVVEVEEVLWVRNDKDKELRTIRVVNLSLLDGKTGWDKPGRYILPLVKDGEDYGVAAIPSSPGFDGRFEHLRIYPYTPQTLEQQQALRRSYPGPQRKQG